MGTSEKIYNFAIGIYQKSLEMAGGKNSQLLFVLSVMCIVMVIIISTINAGRHNSHSGAYNKGKGSFVFGILAGLFLLGTMFALTVELTRQ